jgi:archaellum component FlaC
VLQDEDMQKLDEPIRGSSYTHALNGIRLDLVGRYSWFSEHVVRLKDKIAEIEAASVLSETVSLPRYVQDVQNITNDAEKLAQNWQQYQRNIDLLMRWHQFTDDEVQVRDTVSRMGEPGAEFVAELDVLAQNIQTILEQNGEQALSSVTDFAYRLKSISDAISKRRSSANVKFDREETAYRRALIRNGGLCESDLWDKLPFNPEKPGRFYSHLYSQVRQHIAKILDDVSEQIQRQHDDLTMLANNQLLIDAGQTDTVVGLQNELGKLRDYLSQPYALNTEDGVQDYEGSFTRIISMIGDIKHNVRSVAEEVAHLKSLAQPQSRSQDAEAIYQALEQHHGGEGQLVDLVQLRETTRNISPGMTDTQFWGAIRELWEQQWVRIVLK